MNMLRQFSLAAVLGTSSVAGVFADSPLPGAKPIVEIVQRLEKEGYSPVTGFSFDDGVWEVEVSKGNASLELVVDPQSGATLNEYPDDVDPRPPKGTMPLSELLLGLQKAGYDNFHDASFERRYWEIELYRDGVERELQVDPATGKVVADRVD